MNAIHACRAVTMLLLVLAMWIPGKAQSDDIPRVSAAYALTNVTVVQEPGVTLENATVVIEHGLIQTVGAKVPVPTHARIIKCDSMYLYAGFIEGISHTGIPTKDSEDRRQGNEDRVEDPGNPPNDKAGITPEKSAVDLFMSSDRTVRDMRELGFTASHVVPRDGMLPGKGSLFLLGTGDADKLVIAENISLYAQFDPARRMYPGTTIGVMAKWRDLYREAEYLSKHKRLYKESGGGTTRPKYDKATEAMFDVVDGTIPVYFKVPDALDIHKAADLKESLGFEIAFCEVNESWYASERIQAMGAPSFVTMDLPDVPKEKKDEDDDDSETNPEREALEQRRAESVEKHFVQAAALARMGIPMAFSTLEVKSKDIHSNVRTMIEHGLNPDTALAAFTTFPAQILGVDDVMGTVTPGKMANVFVSNKPWFDEDSKVKYVFVEGEMFEYEIAEKKKKKRGDESAEPADITGRWSYEVDVMGQVYTGVLNFSGTDGDYRGQMTSDEDGETTDLEGVSVQGTNVTFSMLMDNQGMQMKLDFDIEITDAVFEGDVNVGEFGTYEIEGARIPN